MRKFHARFGFELLDDDLDSVLVILICPFKELKARRYLWRHLSIFETHQDEVDCKVQQPHDTTSSCCGSAPAHNLVLTGQPEEKKA